MLSFCLCRKDYDLQKKSDVTLALCYALYVHAYTHCFTKFPIELRRVFTMDSKEASFTFIWKKAFLSSMKDPLSSISISGFCKEARKWEKKEWNETNIKLYLKAHLKNVLLEQCFPNSPNKTQLGKSKNMQVLKTLPGDSEQQVRPRNYFLTSTRWFLCSGIIILNLCSRAARTFAIATH